jgi:hypothetical protein
MKKVVLWSRRCGVPPLISETPEKRTVCAYEQI